MKMFIKLRNDEAVIIESDRDKLTVKSDRHGQISFDGAAKEKSIKDIEYEDILKKMREDFFNTEKNFGGWGKSNDEHRTNSEKTIKWIEEYVGALAKKLKLHKGIILAALERNRTYRYNNYYQPCNFPRLNDIAALEKKNAELEQQIWDLKKAHDNEIVEWEKKVTEAMGFKVKKVVAKGSGHTDFGISVNCPHCDRWQQVKDLGDWYPNDGKFEGNQECEDCSKIFTVEFDGDF
jgi:hypothetical protein